MMILALGFSGLMLTKKTFFANSWKTFLVKEKHYVTVLRVGGMLCQGSLGIRGEHHSPPVLRIGGMPCPGIRGGVS